MIVMDNGDVENNTSSDEEMPLLGSGSKYELEQPAIERLMVTRSALSIQRKEDGNEVQQENIFHTRNHMNNKVCSIIINNGSASTLFVEKLNLPMLRHCQ